MIAVDGSENALKACEVGATLARTYSAEVTVIHVVPSPSIYGGQLVDEEFYERLDKEAKALTEKAASVIEKRDVAKVRREILWARASIAQTLLDHASSTGSDLIITGTRGLGGFRRMMLGSVSSGLVANAKCPVLVVRMDSYGKSPEFRRILVAVDGSEHARTAARMAVYMAKELRVELTALYIMTLPWAAYSGGVAVPIEKIEERLREVGEKATGEVAAMAQKEGIKVKLAIEEEIESPVRGITKYATSETIDLIMLGTRGLGEVKRLLLGSVASGVVTYAKCSVLVVP